MTSIPTPVFGSPHPTIAARAAMRTMRRSTSAHLQRRADRRAATGVVDDAEDKAVVIAADGASCVVPHVPHHRDLAGPRADADRVDRQVPDRRGPVEATRLDERIEWPAERSDVRTEADGRADGLADRIRRLHH